MGNRFSIYPASFIHAGGTLNLPQMRSQSLRRNGSFNAIRPGGSLDNSAYILSTANPTCGMSTRDLATVLSSVSITNGLYCNGGHVMRWQRRLSGGAFDPTLSHTTQTTPRGFLNIAQLEVDIDSTTGAECALEYTPLSLAGENPVSTASGVALGGVAPAFNSAYYMGGAWLGAAQLTGLIRARVVPGITYSARRSDGGVFPRADCSSIVARDPSIQLDFLNVAMISTTLGNFFASAMPDSLSVYFRAGAISNDGRVPTSVASHTRITASAGTWGPDDVSVSDESDGVVTVSIMPSQPLAINLTSLIP